MLVLLAQLIGERGGASVVGLDRGVERREVVGLRDLEALENGFLGLSRGLGDLGDGGGATELVCQEAHGLRELEMQLL